MGREKAHCNAGDASLPTVIASHRDTMISRFSTLSIAVGFEVGKVLTGAELLSRVSVFRGIIVLLQLQRQGLSVTVDRASHIEHVVKKPCRHSQTRCNN
jgi:hypothetical protein